MTDILNAGAFECMKADMPSEPTMRPLSPDEVSTCLDGASQFFDEAELPMDLVPHLFVENWRNKIEEDRGVIIGLFDGDTIVGGLGAVKCPEINSGEMMAVECWWHVQKPYRSRGWGLRLLDAYERWARKIGAKKVCMIHLVNLQPEKLGALYESRGYRKVEVNYIKELK